MTREGSRRNTTMQVPILGMTELSVRLFVFISLLVPTQENREINVEAIALDLHSIQ